MADFRKISVLVALVLLLGVSASAQPLSCFANAAVPPTLRAEGMTELIGDIVLTCTGGIPTLAGSAITNRVNFVVYLNTNITSRTYASGTFNNNDSEALLIIDEPALGVTGANQSPLLLCATPLTGCSVNGNGTNVGGVVYPGATTPYNGTTGANVYRGIVAGNQVQFIGVPVDPPGSTGTRVIRFTNIRANATGISASSGSGLPGTLQALISASGTQSLPITSPTQIVGYVQPGMTFTPRRRDAIDTAPNNNTHISFPQCSSLSRTATNTNNLILEFKEGFPTAFKTRGTQTQSIPGTIYNTESGFTAAVLSTYGYADSATRFKATLTNLPSGVSVYASTRAWVSTLGSTALTNSNAKLVSGEVNPVDAIASYSDFWSPNQAPIPLGGAANVGGNVSGSQLAVLNNTATAVWEVTASEQLAAETFYTLIWFSYTQQAAQNSPPVGTATVTGSFAPTPTGIGVSTSAAANPPLTGTTQQTLPIPRFREGTDSRAAFAIYVCRTNLLFPFVTNQATFDTGLAIANTSLDTGIFFTNTTAQTGSCTVYAFGDNAPASFSTGTVAPGKVWVDLASTKLPNFQGYLIAQCAFQYAHGFAFISDFGAQKLAMGYLALIIPEVGNGTRSANFPASGGSGEQLAN